MFRYSLLVRVALPLVCAFVCWACTNTTQRATVETTSGSTDRTESIPAEASDEARFAQALLAALGTNETSTVIDWVSIIESSLPERLVENRVQFRDAMVERMEREGVLALLRGGRAQGDAYSARTAEREGQRVVRLRHIGRSGGVNFYDFRVASCDGAPCARDVYDAAAGHWIRDELNRVINLIISPDGSFNEHSQTFSFWTRTIRALYEAEDWPRVMQVWEAMPEELQSATAMLNMRLDAADHLGDTAYLAALDDILYRFERSVPAHLIAIDAYMLREQWQKLRQSIAIVRQELPDPYWLVLDALISLGEGDVDGFERILARCISEDPHSAYPHEFGLVVWLGAGDSTRANVHLQALISKFGVDPRSFLGREDYAGVEQLEAFPR